jgi:hypothetical protein
MIYEVVYNQNGVLTSDWEQELVVESKNIKWGSDSLLEECGGGSSSGCGGSSSPKSSYSSCGGGSYSGCGGSSGSETTREPTEEELRLAKLKERDKKVKKVVKKVKKELASESQPEVEEKDKVVIVPKNDDTTTSTGDYDFTYTLKEAKEEKGGYAVITIDHLDGNYKGKVLKLPESKELIRKRFKLYDDDGELYYSGYFYDDPACENQDALLSWGMYDSGCTLIKVAVGRGPFEVEIG